eukprot:scpid23939/ scgid21610/ 
MSFPDCNSWLCTCGKCNCGLHPCAIHKKGARQRDGLGQSQYNTTYVAAPAGDTRRITKCPVLVNRRPSEYTEKDLVSTKQSDYINHCQPKPNMVKKPDVYEPPTDKPESLTSYGQNFIGLQGPRAQNMRPPTEYSTKGPMLLNTTNREEFRPWDKSKPAMIFRDPTPRKFFDGNFLGLSTNQSDFNAEQAKLGRPSTMCRIQETAIRSTDPMEHTTTMREAFTHRGYEPSHIAHKNVKKNAPQQSDIPMNLMTQYESSHPQAQPFQRRRNAVPPFPDLINLKLDDEVRLETENRSKYLLHSTKPATRCKPNETKHTVDTPFNETTTNLTQFANRGPPEPAKSLRPPTNTKQRGEVHLKTTHQDEFTAKTTRPRTRHGNHRDTSLRQPGNFTGLSTFNSDYLNYGSRAKPAEAVKPLDQRFTSPKGANQVPGVVGVPTYKSMYTKKPSQRLCPAALVPVAGTIPWRY